MTTRNLEFYSDWPAFDKLEVLVPIEEGGESWRFQLRVSTFTSIYPFREKVVMASAYPMDKESKDYLETKRVLGDDWAIDIFGSDLSVESRFYQAACEEVAKQPEAGKGGIGESKMA